MRSFIRHLGILDQQNVVHAVSFGPGVNVITGRSSTGKSALIEIFDFCFGSSDFTVPDGVITAHASIYFTVLSVKDTNLVLARRRGETKAFLKEETDVNVVSDLKTFSPEYFDDSHFTNLDDYKDRIGRYFGLTITDVDETEDERIFRGRKKSTPSIRSFASYMLQHQNLVANKHAVFYRFDEKEKREQAIDHFKIFMGFADQAYFLKAQELHQLEVDHRRISGRLPYEEETRAAAEKTLESGLLEYLSISGQKLSTVDVKSAVKAPQKTLDEIRKFRVSVLPVSNEHAEIKSRLEEEKARKTATLRRQHHRLAEVEASIGFARKYISETGEIGVPSSAELKVSLCPFCDQPNTAVEDEANKLTSAINWLNDELKRSPYILDSFEENEKRLKREIAATTEEMAAIDGKIAVVDQQVTDLERLRTQYELALESKFRIEQTLQELADGRRSDLKAELERLKAKMAEISSYMKSNYDIEGKLRAAEKDIADAMAEIGGNFEFEYKPIKLRFSLDTFDLWHEAAGRKVFLRSMGSGANWLYSHVTLFLALQRYFCSLGDRCAIPTILFFDQPSQVYFPSSTYDTEEQFSKEAIFEKEGGEKRQRPIDDDIRAVTELYNELVQFCHETEKKTGIMPQIIVTDHADNLTLAGGLNFEDLVQGRRWRKRGFIHPVDDKLVREASEAPAPPLCQ